MLHFTSELGKSYVIKAIMEFARRWSIGGDIVCTATSGVAACLLGGMTWLKAFGIGIRMNNPDPNEQVKAAWQTVKLMIIDEISMLKAGGLGVIDERLRKIFGNDLPFGGIHILLVGNIVLLFRIASIPPSNSSNTSTNIAHHTRYILMMNQKLKSHSHIHIGR
jgi:ATP-dependent DNA helicase PIF1